MRIRVLVGAVIGFLVAGCGTPVVRNALPEEYHLEATVLDGEHQYRYWGGGDGISDHPLEAFTLDDPGRYAGIMHQEHNYLILSGGGANGAYGAGVLKAWSDLGTRPEFTFVTGISTGALTAPLAFLGSDFDDDLEELYTTLQTSDLIAEKGFWDIVRGDGVVDTTPLLNKLEQVIDDQVIQALAREYERGRTLSVGTTNLDAGRPVVWNITRMAASGHPQAPDLIRRVLLASASIPGAFPPVYIPVQTADGAGFDEMHVDGGATSQMFFYPASVNWSKLEEALDVKGRPNVFIIRNAWLDPDYEAVDPRLLPIAGRTINSLIRTQGIGDFYRMWSLAERDKLNVSVTWIPRDAKQAINVEPTEAFDPKYMKAMFDYAYRRTIDGETWFDAPHIKATGERLGMGERQDP